MSTIRITELYWFTHCYYLCRWGCDHEQAAIEAYTAEAAKHHEGLKVSMAGMFVDTEHPFVAASPDGIISCTCCGKGTLEVVSFLHQRRPTRGRERKPLSDIAVWKMDTFKRPCLLLPSADTARRLQTSVQ